MGQLTNQLSMSTDGTQLQSIYTYNSAGQLTTLAYPSDRIVSYGYDSQGRINQISTNNDAGTALQVLASAIQYYPFGAVRSFT